MTGILCPLEIHMIYINNLFKIEKKKCRQQTYLPSLKLISMQHDSLESRVDCSLQFLSKYL